MKTRNRQYVNISNGLTFDKALLLLKRGKYVTRKIWTKSNYVMLDGTLLFTNGVKTIIWQPSPYDITASDWAIVKGD